MTYTIPNRTPEPVYISQVLEGPHQTPEQEGTDEWTIIVETMEYDSITQEPMQYEDEIVGSLADVYEIVPGRIYKLYWNEENSESEKTT